MSDPVVPDELVERVARALREHRPWVDHNGTYATCHGEPWNGAGSVFAHQAEEVARAAFAAALTGPCTTCEGTGKASGYDAPLGHPDSLRCPDCGGSGSRRTAYLASELKQHALISKRFPHIITTRREEYPQIDDWVPAFRLVTEETP